MLRQWEWYNKDIDLKDRKDKVDADIAVSSEATSYRTSKILSDSFWAIFDWFAPIITRKNDDDARKNTSAERWDWNKFLKWEAGRSFLFGRYFRVNYTWRQNLKLDWTNGNPKHALPIFRELAKLFEFMLLHTDDDFIDVELNTWMFVDNDWNWKNWLIKSIFQLLDEQWVLHEIQWSPQVKRVSITDRIENAGIEKFSHNYMGKIILRIKKDEA